MKEILMEIELLYSKMNEVNKEVETKMGNKDMPFSKVLYAITKGVTNEEMFSMTDLELKKLIHKIQIIEG